VPDFIWPHIVGDPIEEPQPLPPLVLNPPFLDRIDTEVSKLIDGEDERRRGIDSRLTPLIPIAAIMATALVASVPVALSGSVAKVGVLEALLSLAVLYIALQLLICLHATIGGLGRRDYSRIAIDKDLPELAETETVWLTRLVNEKRAVLAHNAWVNNAKLDEMSVAHAALKNAVRGAAVVVLIAVAIAVDRGGASSGAGQEVPAISQTANPTTTASTSTH
jgi:hypothetical protein